LLLVAGRQPQRWPILPQAGGIVVSGESEEDFTSSVPE
jgi:hypothetical protein